MNPQITPPPQGGYAYPCPVCHQQAAFDEDIKIASIEKRVGWALGLLTIIYGLLRGTWSTVVPICVFGVLILLVSTFMFQSKNVVGVSRTCQKCGHSWRTH